MPTDNVRNDIMSLEEFTGWFASEFDWCPDDVTVDDNLVVDLGMDSVGAVDLMVGLEDAVGGDLILPIELILEIEMVRDAYLQYCTLAHTPLDAGATR